MAIAVHITFEDWQPASFAFVKSIRQLVEQFFDELVVLFDLGAIEAELQTKAAGVDVVSTCWCALIGKVFDGSAV